MFSSPGETLSGGLESLAGRAARSIVDISRQQSDIVLAKLPGSVP